MERYTGRIVKPGIVIEPLGRVATIDKHQMTSVSQWDAAVGLVDTSETRCKMFTFHT